MAKEYIARDAVLKEIKDTEAVAIFAKSSWPETWKDMQTNIRNLPAADVVEVVRCEDCKSRHDSCFAGVGNTYCDVHHKYFPLDGFCSDGERRDNNAAD